MTISAGKGTRQPRDAVAWLRSLYSVCRRVFAEDMRKGVVCEVPMSGREIMRRRGTIMVRMWAKTLAPFVGGSNSRGRRHHIVPGQPNWPDNQPKPIRMHSFTG